MPSLQLSCSHDWLSHLRAEISLQVGHKMICQCVCVVAVRLHKALKWHCPTVHTHTVKEGVSCLPLQHAHRRQALSLHWSDNEHNARTALPSKLVHQG